MAITKQRHLFERNVEIIKAIFLDCCDDWYFMRCILWPVRERNCHDWHDMHVFRRSVPFMHRQKE
jgi:hypothetical protein